MVLYSVRFDDGEHIMSTPSFEKAKKYRDENNFKYLSRSIHIYEITTWNGWNETKII